VAVAVKISLAGRVTIGVSGTADVEVELGARARVALGYLVLERSRPVGRDELADVVWGADLPATWPDALRNVVARVRTALRAAGLDVAEVLTTTQAGYQLHLPPEVQVDVDIASKALHEARDALASDAGEAMLQAHRAVDGSLGEFLAGASGIWVERRQAELRQLHVEALEVLSQAATTCGDTATGVWAADEAIGLQPVRESAHLCLMAAHAGAGNRGEALRAYARCRQVLVEELGVGPSAETESTYVKLLGEEPEPEDERPRGLPPHNLPTAVTTFVGRERDRQELERLLRSARLVTLTGMGGAGKSRLGLEVARDVLVDQPDGVWLVELAGIADSAFVAEHIFGVIGRPDRVGRSPMNSLIDHFRASTSLLLLDNCEHVVAGCAVLCDALLRACPRLRILTTSREPLSAAGETIWPVTPLATPGPGHAGGADSLLAYESVRLFSERAQSAFPGFELAPVSDATAEICRRLDGIPLAIELAAARTRQLAVPEIARRLGDRFGLLVGGPRTTPERHRTLRRAIDWSYETLTASEREVLDRMSVFAGSFTLRTSETICRDLPDVLDCLSGLVDKSLVVPDRSGREMRYRMLETVRAYGQERLTAAGYDGVTRSAQLVWATNLAESAEGALEGPRQAEWLHFLDAEQDNLRGTLDWAASHGSGEGLRLAASLWRYWEVRGFLSEGLSRLEAFLHTDARPDALRAKALTSAGILAQNQLDHTRARAYYDEALDIHRSLGDRLGTATALNGLGNVAVGEGDLTAAQELFEQNLVTSREIGEPQLLAAALMNLGVVLQLRFVSGETERLEGALRAHRLYGESLLCYRQLGDRHGVALALENLGAVAPYRDDYPGAQAFLEESLALRRELRDKSGIAASARFLGHLALRDREFGAARRLHEESLSIESELGNQLLMATDLASLADIADGEGDDAEARTLRNRALELFVEAGDDAGTRKARRALARLPASPA